MQDKSFKEPADERVRDVMDKAVMESENVTRQRIGRSILSRDINAYFVGKGRRRVIYFGAHHAAESITCNLLFTFLYALSRGDRARLGVQDVSILLEKYTYIIVPCVNPDGVELRISGVLDSPLAPRQAAMTAGRYIDWQANGRGVDLNHNYTVGFNEYKAIEWERGITAGRSLFSGEYPESEPETRAVMGLVRTVMPSGVISLHTQGEEIYYKPYTPGAKRVAARLSERCGYRVSVPEGTAAYGGLTDALGEMGIPSFTIEAGRGKNPLPESSLENIFTSLAPTLALFPTML